ncbi:nuclear transport factor 2 family protein [Kribbella sp. NPDC051770]|uniref:nuclear transport factor 2 family protein n=1 Tax=Kribbella sp. NPDC051770 TaxID=3155413 RepID=UPI0034160A6C
MTVEDEVRAVSAAFDAVLVENDAAAIGRFMTADWVYVGPTGAVARAELLGWIESGHLVHHTMRVIGDQRVVRVGDTVVLTARKPSSGTWAGTPYTADEWITEIYVRVDGDWRCAFSQKTDAAD